MEGRPISQHLHRPHGLLHAHAQHDPLALGHRPEGGQRFLNRRRQIQRLDLKSATAVLQRLHVEKISDHVGHLVHQRLDPLEGFVRRSVGIEPHQLKAHVDPRQRTAQIVSSHAHEPAFFLVEPLQAGLGSLQVTLDAQAFFQFGSQAQVPPHDQPADQSRQRRQSTRPAHQIVPADDIRIIQFHPRGDDRLALPQVQRSHALVEYVAEHGLVPAHRIAQLKEIRHDPRDLEVGQPEIADNVVRVGNVRGHGVGLSL